jgi:hypothetical protein
MRKPNEVVQLKLRFAERLRARLEKAAAKTDASLNTEIVQRLERSFRRESDNLLGAIVRNAIGRETLYEPPEHGGHFAMSASVKAQVIERLTAFINSIPTAEEPTLTDEEAKELSEMVDRANRDILQQKVRRDADAA